MKKNSFILKGNNCYSISRTEIKTLANPLELNLRQRIERSIYLSLDMCGGIKEKYVCANRII